MGKNGLSGNSKEICKNTIDFNMKKIEKEMQMKKMSMNQRIRREMIEQTKNKNISDKEVQDRVMELNKKKCTSNF